MNAAPSETKLTHNEVIKTAIPTLAGNISATLDNTETDQFEADDQQFLKFHGIYQQDDRDLRKTGKKYIMMIRGRIPGGVMTSKQWQVFDDLADDSGNGTLRVTTRQSIQFHGVVKGRLRQLVKRINDSLLSTLAACGDVNRNVLAPPTPAYTKAREEVFADCNTVALALAPQTKAYHSIWIDGAQLNLDDEENKGFVDPLYGKTYLPRKFKTAFVIPPLNDVDILTNDLGFIAVVENDKLIGYNLAVGGGLGRSHGNQQTFPRLADVLGFFPRENLIEVAKAVLTIHRDFGDRTDRKRARLKYVIEEKGADWAREEVNRRAGIELQPAKPFTFEQQKDLYGWHQQVDGNQFFGLFIETGRIKDTEAVRMKKALRTIADRFDIEFRLTANQNVVLANIKPADKDAINGILEQHGIRTDHEQATPLHAAMMACPSLPTCGLGLAESERYLPGLIDRIEKLCDEAGIGGEEIIIRMTGCPNGCARPYMAEIGFVGKGPGRYQLWLGSNVAGTRLNRLWKEMVKDAEMEDELRPLLTRYAKERNGGERFGDWCDRVLLQEAATN
ncbi:MAG TPA: NADPH-dependent assimilatory sulfite reductase hemoprotein subunit [Verrucomicrobiales bacterium]|nr:NADPH-dependent assimilatory sulfite reductase hemoprotein subunit [Verrucomicrobiales bacterium]